MFITPQNARSYFGAEMPAQFLAGVYQLQAAASTYGTTLEDIAWDLFGVVELGGYSLRYSQTPPELFPFARTGGDGIHYGFVMHEEGHPSYPAAEICPMDSDGAILLAHNPQELWQNLLEEDADVRARYAGLLQTLGLEAIATQKQRWRYFEAKFRAQPAARAGWHWQPTSDGVGVFAPDQYFRTRHRSYNPSAADEAADFQQLADDCRNEALYGSQLYYLKEAFWHTWATSHERAVELLQAMLLPYEQLGRAHLHAVTQRLIQDFQLGRI
ncbi:hypothetical protein [Hymenobacter jeollabukensis]|uniref:Uncharacterized protein n=1 Tax=Hymenobacter jeollabukensis TaxID=2025313 RepID=A0A5R8WRK0_9BACT|nr:hypothetical protein [Hymenobacter jeollabukensis]TLM93316.1 hypothetical protein FDY95_11905 [Hymenobacter jeollabukensis]